MGRQPAAKNNWRQRLLFRYDGHPRKAGVSKRNRQARNRWTRRRQRSRLSGADYRSDGPRPPDPQP